MKRGIAVTGKEVPEIILLNSHDGSSSYQMLQGMFRFACANGLICGHSFGEVCVPHLGDVTEKVIEGAYEVLGIFDDMEAMKSISLTLNEQSLFARAALTYRYEEHDKFPITESQLLTPRRWEDKKDDLWTTFQYVQENMIKGGLS